MTARLERYRDMAPQHLRMARRMLDGWGEFDAESMPAELRRFAAGDGCDAVDLAGRLLAGALEYLRFALETIEDEEGRMGEIELTRRYPDRHRGHRAQAGAQDEGGRMTATDELRRLLDERGADWWQSVNVLGCVFTRWYSPLFSDEVVAMENGDGELELFSHLMTPEQAVEATLGGDLKAENDKLREQTEMLVTLLRNDCDIEASWDGLRKFWNIGLTENGCLMRDRACKAEAENEELRDDLQRANDAVCDAEHDESRAWDRVRKVEAENAKLRELLADFRDTMWNGGEWTEPFDERMRDLGVEI